MVNLGLLPLPKLDGSEDRPQTREEVDQAVEVVHLPQPLESLASEPKSLVYNTWGTFNSTLRMLEVQIS